MHIICHQQLANISKSHPVSISATNGIRNKGELSCFFAFCFPFCISRARHHTHTHTHRLNFTTRWPLCVCVFMHACCEYEITHSDAVLYLVSRPLAGSCSLLESRNCSCMGSMLLLHAKFPAKAALLLTSMIHLSC